MIISSNNQVFMLSLVGLLKQMLLVLPVIVVNFIPFF